MKLRSVFAIIVCIVCSSFVFVSAVPANEKAAQNMKNELLKCKDVVDVVVKIPDSLMYINAEVYVYLTNDRYLKFSCVDYKMKDPEMYFSRIGNIMPWTCYYEHHRRSNDELGGRMATLADLKHFFPKVKSVKDVINNYDEVYELISSLNEKPENYHKKYDFDINAPDKMDLSDWDKLESEALYSIGLSRYKLFKHFPKEQ